MPNASIYLCQVDSVLSIDDPILDDLFRRLEIDNNRVGISRYGWRNALDRLLEMQNCPAALERAETLHVDIFIHRNREPLNPPSELLGLFALVLDSMPNLGTIIWDMPCEQTPLFGEALAARNSKLPSIRSLSVGPFSEYLVPLCPNVDTLTYSPKEWHCDWKVKSGRPPPRELLVKAGSS